ncbi:hypothetical protein [Synechococcus sp. UW179A]|uniref:hypothetical protein n=1 Tax=Synechococcus sp. UW179A TaxID=2575510 RepID=UPI000E0EC820|nr:hypothetical protein [Synechococcus sp. UW179A]
MYFLNNLRFSTVAVISALFALSPVSHAQSSLLESVKRNPGEAQALCQQFKSINSRGESALSSQSIAVIAGQRNLNKTEAEIVATYVIGLNCPDVR